MVQQHAKMWWDILYVFIGDSYRSSISNGRISKIG